MYKHSISSALFGDLCKYTSTSQPMNRKPHCLSRTSPTEGCHKVVKMQRLQKLQKPCHTFSPALLEYSRTKSESAGPKTFTQTHFNLTNLPDLLSPCPAGLAIWAPLQNIVPKPFCLRHINVGECMEKIRFHKCLRVGKVSRFI